MGNKGVCRQLILFYRSFTFRRCWCLQSSTSRWHCRCLPVR